MSNKYFTEGVCLSEFPTPLYNLNMSTYWHISWPMVLNSWLNVMLSNHVYTQFILICNDCPSGLMLLVACVLSDHGQICLFCTITGLCCHSFIGFCVDLLE